MKGRRAEMRREGVKGLTKKNLVPLPFFVRNRFSDLLLKRLDLFGWLCVGAAVVPYLESFAN